MTKRELLKRLAKYPDDSEIVIEWEVTSAECSPSILVSKYPSSDLAWEQKHNGAYMPTNNAIYLHAL